MDQDRILWSIQDGFQNQKPSEFQVNRKLKYTKREDGIDGNDVRAAPSCQGRTSSLNGTLVATPNDGLKKKDLSILSV